MKIFDCILFNGEVNLLEIRLNELDSFVDYFIVVESDTSFSGIKKQYTDLSGLDHRIRHIKVCDGMASYENKPYHRFFHYEPMRREFFLRDQILSGIQDASPDDIILISDSDEIPILQNLDSRNDIFIFWQDCLQLKYDLFNPGLTPWFGTVGAKYKHLGLPSELRIHHRDYVGVDRYKNLKLQKVRNGGWHFSYCMNPKEILNKVKNYAHCDRITEINEQHLEYCLKNKKDIWKGKYNTIRATVDLEPYPHEKLPKTISNNKDKYRLYLDIK